MKLLRLFSLSASLYIFSILASGCNGQEYDVNDENYELHKTKMEKAEEKKPEKFLSVKSSYKKNLLGQSVVSGIIYNNAKVANYKDIEIKLQFYSKTNSLLEEDVETIYEEVNAGGITKFKSKYFSPKGTNSVVVTVQKAVFIP